MKDKKILIIGSNSFSGSSFSAHLLHRGFNVLGCSRSIEPDRAFLPYSWTSTDSRFRFLQMDINSDLEKLIDLIKTEKPSYLVNFSAQSMVGESWSKPGDWFKTNVVSTINFHDEIRRFNFIERYVHVSTPEVYGNNNGFIKEGEIFNPSTPYAVSRAACDLSLRTFFAAYNFPVVTTRAANVYGEGQQLYRIIPRSILYLMLGKKIELHGGGLSTRSFIHIDDVSRATEKIMLSGKSGEDYHISTDAVISIHDLVAEICQKLSKNINKEVVKVEDRLGKDSTYQLDSSKLRSDLGWVDEVNLDAGLNRTISWVKKYLDVLKDQPMHYIHKE